MLEAYSREIIEAIEQGRVKDKAQLNKLKISLAKKYSLRQMPTNPDILSFSKSPSERLISHLSIKPTRSLSGVAVVAAMAKPHKCPGECIYCPSGIGQDMPKSYTGKEPAARRAAMFNFSPLRQVRNRVSQLNATGHSTEKIELIIMGGTFLSTETSYQNYFVRRCLDAISEKNSRSLKQAKLNAEKSKNRVIGITFETRPDFCGKREINRMLNLGGTRVELGVQNPNDEIYKIVNRGHTVRDVVDATSLLKDSAFKAAYHIIPGLPGTTTQRDLKTFKSLFTNQDYMPDMLKIYPCLVLENTGLHKMWKAGEYTPLTTEKAASFIAELKPHIPKWVRVMRVQRDIPTNLLSAGVGLSNLRQVVERKMEENGTKCNCIRCREAGISQRKGKNPLPEKAKIMEERYDASLGKEIFISAEEPKKDLLYGFCRLRIPAHPFRKEITPQTALIRELHVYGTSLPLGEKPRKEFQHMGFGKALLERAEQVAGEEFGMKKMLVISGLGAREYYRALGYKNDGPYVSKKL